MRSITRVLFQILDQFNYFVLSKFIWKGKEFETTYKFSEGKMYKQIHTLCMVFCCRMHCSDGRIVPAVRFMVVGLVKPPQIGLKMQFVRPWSRQNGNGYKATA